MIVAHFMVEIHGHIMPSISLIARGYHSRSLDRKSSACCSYACCKSSPTIATCGSQVNVTLLSQ